MATKTKTSTTTPTPLLAVVGVTDLAVEQVRTAVANVPAMRAQFEARVQKVQSDVEHRVTDFDPKALREQAAEVPARAAARLLEVASKAQVQVEALTGRVEAGYEGFAARGGKLVDRVAGQASTQALVEQANSTIARTKAAVTVARKSAEDTTSALLGTLTTGRREAATVASTTTAQAETAAKSTATTAKKATTTAQKKAAATKSAAKGARTSAGKTASKATTAAKDAAAKVGD